MSIDRWMALDARVREWWDVDTVTGDQALEATPDTFVLREPYVAGAAPDSPSWYRTMFDWDTHFINLALMVHGRRELIRGHLENYLDMIERFGFMPNSNQLGLTTRSQVPVIIDSFWRYLKTVDDDKLLARVYAALCHEYTGYWLADHHATPTRLVTNRDLGDTKLDPALAAEAETGLDWTTQYEGDITRINPVITNSCLVLYARTLSEMAERLSDPRAAEKWRADAEDRADRIRRLCWDASRGLFMDYNFVEERPVPVAGATAYFALWAGVATDEQAKQSADGLSSLLFAHGLASTEPSTPTGDAFRLAYEDLQWTFPAGWPPLSIVATDGLDRYGLHVHAREVAARQLETIVANYEQDGRLYEKYNVVDGSTVLPNARYGTIPLHGWTSAAVVLLGRRVHLDQTIDAQLAAADLDSRWPEVSPTFPE